MSEEKKSAELTTRQASSLESLAGMSSVGAITDRSDRTGIEHITFDKINTPRVLLAQSTSLALVDGDESFIPGLKRGDIYNTVTKENYGKGPLVWVPVFFFERRIEFDANNKIVDIDVPPNDPRMHWSKDPATGRFTVPPKADTFHNYVAYINPRPGELLDVGVISIKISNKFNEKASKFLFTEMSRGGAIFSRWFFASAKLEKSDSGYYAVWAMSKHQVPNADGSMSDANVLDPVRAEGILKAARDLFNFCKAAGLDKNFTPANEEQPQGAVPAAPGEDGGREPGSDDDIE